MVAQDVGWLQAGQEALATDILRRRSGRLVEQCNWAPEECGDSGHGARGDHQPANQHSIPPKRVSRAHDTSKARISLLGEAGMAAPSARERKRVTGGGCVKLSSAYTQGGVSNAAIDVRIVIAYLKPDGNP